MTKRPVWDLSLELLREWDRGVIRLREWVNGAITRVRRRAWAFPSSYLFMPPAPNVTVSAEKALTYSGVKTCISQIADSLSMLPIDEFEYVDELRNRKKTLHTTVWYLLNVQANTEMSAVEFKQALIANAVLYGNGYAEIETDGAGRPVWLWPIPSELITPERDLTTNFLTYNYMSGEGLIKIPPSRILHLKGLTFDGTVGLGLLQLAQRSIALGIALETFGLTFFTNNAIPGGVIEAPPGVRMTPQQITSLISDFYETHGGSGKSNRVAYLPEGMQYKQLTIPMGAAQFTEARRLQLEELARWTGVPLHKMALLDRATWDNVEQEQLQFTTGTLVPWATRIEQEVALKLYGRNLRGKRYVRLNMDALLRGDLRSRYEAYSKGILDGHLTRNEAREMEGRDPIEYLNEPLVAVNLTTAERLAKGNTTLDTAPDMEEESDMEDATEIEDESVEEEPEPEIEDASETANVVSHTFNIGPFNFSIPETRVNLEAPPLHINVAAADPAVVHIEPAVVNVEPAVVNVKPAAVNVEPAVVNVEIHPVEPQINVNVESAKQPDMNVHIEPVLPITVESAQGPNVIVNVPETPSTVVVNVPEVPPTVVVNVPEAAVEIVNQIDVPLPVVNVEAPVVNVAPSAAPDVYVSISKGNDDGEETEA